jgi:omega-6 fatty acid desaturase (delta-12 desaturase)
VWPSLAPAEGPGGVRRALSRYAGRSTSLGLLIFAVDLAVYVSGLAVALAAGPWWLRLAGSLAAGLATSLLFVVGHDACHGSLTASRRLNEVVGRLAFLPSLHAYSLWDLGHNRTHHVWTNLKGRDYVFAPLSKAEYDALPRRRRAVYRVYRHALGHWLYYLVEIWWRRMVFARASEVDATRRVYTLDSWLVAGYAALLTGVLLAAPRLFPGVSAGPWERLLLGLGLPYLVWNWLMAFVIYLHHTHPRVRWYANAEEWSVFRGQVGATIHNVFPRPVAWLLHNILEHTAHHANPRVPLYALKDAQASLERAFPRDVIVERFSVRGYLRTAARCKLYDFGRHEWVDFRGRPTAAR